MTLRCECGGAVEITTASHGEEAAVEQYECVACGSVGTYSFGPYTDGLSGCLVDA